MRKTKNQDLLKEAVRLADELHYINFKVNELIPKLQEIELTRTEKEIYGNKEELISQIEIY